jgi:hypothetical protein
MARTTKASEQGITRNTIINELSRSPHGKLEEYTPVCVEAAKSEAEFLAHLIAFDKLNGQVRDAKVALPVISLSVAEFCRDQEFLENSLAHMAMLDVRNFVRAFRFAKGLTGLTDVGPKKQQVFGITAEEAREGYRVHVFESMGEIIRKPGPGSMNQIRKVAQRYLRAREENWGWWERTAVQHRKTLRELYALTHTKPSAMADAILFKNEKPRGTIFEAISRLGTMSPEEAAGTILERKIPFLIAKGAMGKKIQDPSVLLALIDRMSPSELVNNMTELERLGVKKEPALRAALEKALTKAGSSKKNTFKATVAAEAVEDEGLKQKLVALQEKQIKQLGGVDGNWAVLADASGSMAPCIEIGRKVAATLAKLVKGEVYLIFFNTSPRVLRATGKTYEDILKESSRVNADGGTSIGCGLQYLLDEKIEIDGIAVVSDAAENTTPFFTEVYGRYSKVFDKEPPVYLYRVGGRMSYADHDLAVSMKGAKIDLQEFSLPGSVDFYSLANTVGTMRVSRYGLVQKIMETPLVTLATVLPLRERAAV